MKLSEELLAAWARAAVTYFETGGESCPSVEGLRPRDIQLAGDVSSFMPILYYLARWTLLAPQPRFVEIGTADGSSALPLAKAASERGGHLHSVDPSGCEDAHLLIDQFGYRGCWTHHVMGSDDFFRTFADTIDFAFIDGDHRWTVVERDVRNCYKWLRPGGLIWISDFVSMPSESASYEHEYDGPTFVPFRSGDPLHEAQSSNGIGKALFRVLPTLPRATWVHISIYPNPSVLIRKRYESEIL